MIMNSIERHRERLKHEDLVRRRLAATFADFLLVCNLLPDLCRDLPLTVYHQFRPEMNQEECERASLGLMESRPELFGDLTEVVTLPEDEQGEKLLGSLMAGVSNAG